MSSLELLTHLIADVTIKSAIACYHWIGKGDEKSADAAAVAAMRLGLNQMPINGLIVIGEGERDKAPMLHIGEVVGAGGIAIDIAVDPLEGTTICAEGKSDAVSVIAISESSNILQAPDLYMKKIAVGRGLPKNIGDLDASVEDNLNSLAEARKMDVSDLTVCILRRDRHEDLIKEVRRLGARVKLIDDGDVLACLKTTLSGGDIDMYIGTGGAPEGVLAAAGLKSLGGFMQGKLVFNDDNERNRATAMGIVDLEKKYNIDDMIKGNAILSMSWVTDGWLKGIKRDNNGDFLVETILIFSNKIQYIKSKILK